ncbi:MAG TPA: alpha-amylase family glycosyl hydrolase, partial [Spirochaetota bacterium]|nr:alpha-amylase family glycosyl hydrolase [Spirochaetota bacterium]
MTSIQQHNKHPHDYLWWKHGVIYQIYPRSFYDANDDGIGDLPGIIKKFDYLIDLGIDAIWLSPINTSPMYDCGYDVSDYYSIDPIFGTLKDFKELLAIAHSNNIHIIMDMVLNHTSQLHPWFVESSSSRYNMKNDWYIWHDGFNGKPPNNWKSAYLSSAWEKNEMRRQYYLHSFLKEQPDLNWHNQQ